MESAARFRETGLSEAKQRPRAEPREPDLLTLNLSAEGRITGCNAGAQKLLGGERLEGRGLEELFPGAAAALRSGLAGGSQRQSFCVAPLGARSGGALALLCRALPQGEWEAELVPLCGGSGLEAEILSELLHDLRTPLTTLLGAVELLETGRLGPMPERAANLLKALAGASSQIMELLEKAAERRDAPQAREGAGKGK